MPITFNIIACMLPLIAAEIEVAGVLMGRVIKNCIECPACGAQYSVIVPSAGAEAQVESALHELRYQVTATCGYHPPIIQQQ
jgi:hypothetical protein